MKQFARIAVFTYLLSIMVASVAPHCQAMFDVAPVAAAANASEDCDHDSRAVSGHDKPAQECAAMELAKSIGPLPVASPLAIPSSTNLEPVIIPELVFVKQPDAQPFASRAPPWKRDGFATVFASNHRLLI